METAGVEERQPVNKDWCRSSGLQFSRSSRSMPMKACWPAVKSKRVLRASSCSSEIVTMISLAHVAANSARSDGKIEAAPQKFLKALIGNKSLSFQRDSPFLFFGLTISAAL